MSMFKKLLKLRDTFSERLDSNINALNVIAGGGMSLSNNLLPVSGDRTLQISRGSLNLYDDTGSEIDSIDFSTVSDLDVNIAGSEEKWTDLIDELADGTNAYQLIGELVSRYSYSSRVSFSDLSAYINSYDVSDKNVMLNALFSSADDNGYISRQSFLAVLEQWIGNSKKATDGESYAVDRSNPYGLQAVMEIMVTAVSAAISTVCVVLSGIFGVIGFMIGSIISLLINAVNSIREFSTLRTNEEAATDYVLGPIACDDGHSTYSLADGWHKHICLRESNGVAIFSWPADFNNPTGPRKVNGYLYPCWKAHGLLRYLIGDNSFSLDSQNELIYYSHLEEMADAWKDSRLTQFKYGEDENILTDPRKVGASLLVGFMLQSITGLRHIISPSSMGLMYWTYGSQGESSDFGEVMKSISRLIKSTMDNGFFGDEEGWLQFNASAIATGVNHLANHIKNFIIPNRGSLYGASSQFNNSPASIIENTHGRFPRLNAPIIGSGSGVGVMTDDTIILYPATGVSTYDVGIQADVLPSEFGVVLPQYDDSKLSKVLGTIGMVATVTALAGTALKKAIIKRRYAKSALRAHQVEQARDAYLADPTNTALRTEYVNQVYKYNKYGKWFGWGQYDVANGWVDLSSNDSTVSETQSFTDQSILLKQIKQLING